MFYDHKQVKHANTHWSEMSLFLAALTWVLYVARADKLPVANYLVSIVGLLVCVGNG
jgi:hypothetical protein